MPNGLHTLSRRQNPPVEFDPGPTVGPRMGWDLLRAGLTLIFVAVLGDGSRPSGVWGQVPLRITRGVGRGGIPPEEGKPQNKYVYISAYIIVVKGQVRKT